MSDDVPTWLRQRRPLVQRLLRIATALAALGALSTLTWEVGFERATHTVLNVTRVFLWILVALFGLKVLVAADRRSYVRTQWLQGLLLSITVVLLLTLYLAGGLRWPEALDQGWLAQVYPYAIRIYLLVVAGLLAGQQITRLTELPVRPEVAVLGAFGLLILVGTLLLMMPNASAEAGSLPFVDALFTATSAVCVTGLIVVDTGSFFTPLGQWIILFMIQLGGIGVISSATAVAMFFGGADRLGTRAMLHDILDTRTLGEVKTVLRQIVLVTLAIELAGAVWIYFAVGGWIETVPRRMYFSLFHAISAFCNAGFTTLSRSLAYPRLASDLPLNVGFMLLIVLGGIGFIVLRDTFSLHRLPSFQPTRRTDYSVQVRLVWLTTLVLIIGGALGFFLLERGASLAAASGIDTWSDDVMASFFQSITARTAGFNTVDISKTSVPGALMLMVLMFIGAAPGSTGGGIRVTTFALLILFVIAQLKGKGRVDVFGRSLSTETLLKAITVFIGAAGFVILSTLLLAVFEDFPILDLGFEAVSAFATVGLSRGITSHLSVPGKLIITANMFIGRVGLIVLAIFLSRQAHTPDYKYPEESVMVA